MKHKTKQICIYPKDASIITGRSVRACYKLFIRIRRHYRKQPHHAVTIAEFCQFLGLNDEQVYAALEK